MIRHTPRNRWKAFCNIESVQASLLTRDAASRCKIPRMPDMRGTFREKIRIQRKHDIGQVEAVERLNIFSEGLHGTFSLVLISHNLIAVPAGVWEPGEELRDL